jgi:hypothetical protein
MLRSVPPGGPSFGIEPLGGGVDGTNSVAAIGVENVPRLQEYAIHARVRQMNPIGFNTNTPFSPANFQISIDHYFEFWNPSPNDIVLNTNAYIRIYDQPTYGGGAVSGDLANPGRTITIQLTNGYSLSGASYPNGIIFPAGQVTVLTTAPTNYVNTNLTGGAGANIISLLSSDVSGVNLFTGTTSQTNNSSMMGFDRLYMVALDPRSGTFSDYQTAILLGNPDGILDSYQGLPIPTPGGAPAIRIMITNAALSNAIGSTPSAISNGNFYYVRGGSLRGNASMGNPGTPKHSEGDPRTLNEQLEFVNYATSGDGQTRFYDSGSTTTNIPTQSSFGSPNANFVFPTNWVDYSLIGAASAAAPLVVANSSMQSISEVGHITDPARVPVTSTLASVVNSRGGGRTMRIGQPELPSWYDGNQTNSSRTWTSWRLADIFTTTNAVTIDGLINPNGVLRDRGVALRAALHGFTYLASPNGAPNTAGTTLSSNNITTLVTNIVSRMTNTNSFNPTGSLNPFWERGEISELGVLNTGTALLGTGINMSNTIDRGREELIRRSMQMLTTRGSIFTVYVIGQSIQTTATTTNVASTSRLRQVFQLEPLGLNTNDAFNPAAPGARFGKPTGYDVRILSTSYD